MTITPQVGEQFTQQVAADSDNEISQQVAAKLFKDDGWWKRVDGRRLREAWFINNLWITVGLSTFFVLLTKNKI